MATGFRQQLRSALPFALLALVVFFAVSLLHGDGCGPVERGLRALFNGWDMWHTVAQTPYKQPMGSIPAELLSAGADQDEFELAQTAAARLPATERTSGRQQAYRRFCHHCHGPNGDNRIIVGESFNFALPDLRSADIQELGDEDLFNIIAQGSQRMIPLAAMTTPLERLLAVEAMRALKDRPSEPFFPRRWVQPAQEPPALPQPVAR